MEGVRRALRPPGPWPARRAVPVVTPHAVRWPADEPWTPVELLIVRLAAGWPLTDAADDAGMPLPLAAAAAGLHSYPDDMATVRARAVEVYRRHGVENPTYPLPPPAPDAPGETMTEPPTEPTGITLDEPEGQPQPVAAATEPEIIQVPVPADLDPDTDLADIREHERELRRVLTDPTLENLTPAARARLETDVRTITARYGPDGADRYREQHEEGRHEQVPGFSDAVERDARSFLGDLGRRTGVELDAGSFLAELGRRSAGMLDAAGIVERRPPARPRPPIRGLTGGPVIIDEALRLPAPDAVTYGTDPMVGAVIWPGDDPRIASVPEADAEPLVEVDAVPAPGQDDGAGFTREQQVRLDALVEARDLTGLIAPSATDLVLLAEFIITGRSS